MQSWEEKRNRKWARRNQRQAFLKTSPLPVPLLIQQIICIDFENVPSDQVLHRQPQISLPEE